MLHQRVIELLREVDIFQQIIKSSTQFTEVLIRDINRQIDKIDSDPNNLSSFIRNVLVEYYNKYINLSPYDDESFNITASQAEILIAVEYVTQLAEVIVRENLNISAIDRASSNKDAAMFANFNRSRAIIAIKELLQKYIAESSLINKLTDVLNDVEKSKFEINSGTGSRINLGCRDTSLRDILSGQWYTL